MPDWKKLEALKLQAIILLEVIITLVAFFAINSASGIPFPENHTFYL